MNSVLIIGCGDIGSRVARKLSSTPVTGVVRSDAAVQSLQRLSITPLKLDLDRELKAGSLPLHGADLYYFAPPPPGGSIDSRVQAFCAVASTVNRPRKLVYISTSAVYGDCGGNWIDESAPLVPGTERGIRRLDAEQRLLAWSKQFDVPVVILRVPGIYGSGKLPLKRLREGLPVLSSKESPYTNRIHADDLAQICILAMQRGRAGQAYNVSDGKPSSMSDYFNQVADHFGLARPPVVDRATAEKQLSPAMMSFLVESKRLKNNKMLEELEACLRYPDLTAGLNQIKLEIS